MWGIARHLKLLKASVPNLPICTCDTMQYLPLRSEYEQTMGLEKLGKNPRLSYTHIQYNNVHVSFGGSETLNRQSLYSKPCIPDVWLVKDVCIFANCQYVSPNEGTITGTRSLI